MIDTTIDLKCQPMIGNQIMSHDLFQCVSNSWDLVVFVVVDSY